MIKNLRIQLEKSFEVDQLIYSNFYKLSALYYEKKQNHDEFYNNALQYLAYVKENVFIYYNLNSKSLKLKKLIFPIVCVLLV